MMSLNQSLVEEEVRRVQSGHRRVLGELNLSVEAMLMPSSSREGSDDTEGETEDQLADLLTIGPTDELLSPLPIVDLDSGFSGSSSGASYRSAGGSLRRGLDRPKSALSTGVPRSSTPTEQAQSKGFWGKKAWKKLTGFPSTISLNKQRGELLDYINQILIMSEPINFMHFLCAIFCRHGCGFEKDIRFSPILISIYKEFLCFLRHLLAEIF